MAGLYDECGLESNPPDKIYTITYFERQECRKIISKINKLEKEGKLGIFQVDEILFKKAEKIFLKFAEHKLSITDATIYLCVKEFRLDEVFTLDSDFRKIGLKTSLAV
jgi:predicted nucleic acid-binding protein